MKGNRLIKRMILSLCIAISITSAANSLYYGNLAGICDDQQTKLLMQHDEFVNNYVKTDECKNFYKTEKQKLLSKLSMEQITGAEYDAMLTALKKDIVINSLNNSNKSAYEYQSIINEYKTSQEKETYYSRKGLLSIIIAGLCASVPLVEYTVNKYDKLNEDENQASETHFKQ